MHHFGCIGCLGAVCKSWRQAVLSTPRLWCTITLSFSESRRPHILHEKLQLFLSRSKSLPLCISLKAPPALSKSLDEAVVMLLKESHRWRTFHLATDSEAISTLKKTEDMHAPMLHSLRLDVSDSEYCGFFPEPKQTIFNSVQLATLQLHRMCPRLLSLRWDSIETLRATLNLDDCLFLFRVAHFIRTCELTVENSAVEELPTPPYLQPYLSTLTVTEQDGDGDILQSITAPELRKLSTVIGTQVCYADLIEMIERSSCHLVVLDLTAPPFDSESRFLDLFGNLPSLSSLILRGGVLLDKTLDALNPSLAGNSHRTEQECLPSLVSFEYEGGISFWPETMLNMLNSRIDISKRYNESSNASNWPFQRLQVMRIKYDNPDWGKRIHPNTLKDFHKALFSFGEDFDIELVGNNDDPYYRRPNSRTGFHRNR